MSKEVNLGHCGVELIGGWEGTAGQIESVFIREIRGKKFRKRTIKIWRKEKEFRSALTRRRR